MFKSIDWMTIVLYMALVIMGAISIYAASYDFDNASIFSFQEFSGKQITWIGLSLIIGCGILLIDYRIYELASVASSTVSAQLSNMLGQLSDNWSFSPYFRTDKGDFSDMEVDLALSSSLLNNRLLLNGNFGYRDRTTSSTTFVGDFDIEYLLNRPGTIRLKAYNHFNDQNYYLKSALTTQGIGVIFKYDFDEWFAFLRKKEKSKNEAKSDSVPSDTIKTTQPDEAK